GTGGEGYGRATAPRSRTRRSSPRPSNDATGGLASAADGKIMDVVESRSGCARKAWERRKRKRKPFVGTLRVASPARQSLASSRKRVLRGARATGTAKRRQRVSGPCR